MTNTAKKWDPATLPPLTGNSFILRAIDDADIEGWNETEQRWDIAKAAMSEDRLTPSDDSGYGMSFFVEEYLATRCGATPGHELVMLQTHAAQHGCPPTWRDGIVVRIDVRELLALRFGAGESPGDCTCPPVRDAHASIWKGPGWTRKDRAEALKLMGRSYVYEHPDRQQQRLAARISNAPTPSPRAPGTSGNHKP